MGIFLNRIGSSGEIRAELHEGVRSILDDNLAVLERAELDAMVTYNLHTSGSNVNSQYARKFGERMGTDTNILYASGVVDHDIGDTNIVVKTSGDPLSVLKDPTQKNIEDLTAIKAPDSRGEAEAVIGEHEANSRHLVSANAVPTDQMRKYFDQQARVGNS